MDISEFLASGGHLFHSRETAGRVVTVVYTHTDDNKIMYGATIFRPSYGDEVFTKTVRKRSNSTAVARWNSRPVVIDDPGLSAHDTRIAIRSAMYENGVSSGKASSSPDSYSIFWQAAADSSQIKTTGNH